MLMFLALVLVLRSDLRVAVPSGVALMGFTSIVGITATLLGHRLMPGRVVLPPGLLVNWLAAVPVVLVGAPIGAMAVRVAPRKALLAVVCVLCLLPLWWALR
jgi:uncharacterized membrane protein YfcA